MLLFLGAFLAGVLTVLAPCVLALLPVIVGGSISGDSRDRKRPVIIALSLAVSLILFTLLLKASTLLIDIPPRSIAYVSGTIIIALGVLTLFPSIYASFLARIGIEHRAQTALGKSFQNKRQYIGPIATGAALGPVFSSCSPVYAYILATILPTNFTHAIALIIVYVIGLTLVLLLIGYYGQRFIAKIKFASNPKGWFQRAIAILFIITGLLIFTGYDKKFQTYVSEHTPFNFDKLSSKLLPDSKNEIDESKLFNVQPYDAPELVGLQDWVNSDPIQLKDQKGKVVLLDFWTYSCINCIRNNPYIEKWYETYKDKGFVVIGAHAPEFAFEKNPENVRKAIKDQKITYPVALDNDFSTWNAYNNRSWPSSYLIDKDGKVRRVHEGEGQYAESEQAIRELLQEAGAQLDNTLTTNTQTPPVTEQQSPETYLGYGRASNYVGALPLSGTPAVRNFQLKEDLKSNQWSLNGSWEVTPEKIIARGNSTMNFKISAKDVYIVGGSANPQNVSLQLNGQPISATADAGQDIKDSMVTIGESKLYRLVSFPQFTKDQVLTLSVPDGVELNVYTFGS
jgi:cytochrome c biogenesis protein CcdA/thiol-disulfide isomerase/thioredoxin